MNDIGLCMVRRVWMAREAAIIDWRRTCRGDRTMNWTKILHLNPTERSIYLNPTESPTYLSWRLKSIFEVVSLVIYVVSEGARVGWRIKMCGHGAWQPSLFLCSRAARTSLSHFASIDWLIAWIPLQSSATIAWVVYWFVDWARVDRIIEIGYFDREIESIVRSIDFLVEWSIDWVYLDR